MGAVAAQAQESPAGTALQGTVGVPLIGVVASFEESTPEPPSEFGASIDWGDGTPASRGTITGGSACPGRPDRTCYAVVGTHTYAAEGTYTVVTDIRGPSGPVRVRGTATIAPAGEPQAAIAGPARVTLGQPVRFVAETTPAASAFRWDLDGNGTYETDTGSRALVDHSFHSGGSIPVGLVAEFGNGKTATATLTVTVERPSLLALTTKPAYPRAGEPFKLKVSNLREASTELELLTWRIKGVRPKRSQRAVRLGRPAKGGARVIPGARPAPTILRAKKAFATTGPKLKLKLAKPGYYPVEITVHDNKGNVEQLNAGFALAASKPQLPFDKFIDCDKQASLGPGNQEQIAANTVSLYQYCAQFTVTNEPAEGVEVGFQDASPDAEFCEKLKPEPLDPLNAFGFPSPEQFFPELGGPGPLFNRPADRGARAGNEICVKRAFSRVVEWDFGDGTKIDSPQGGIPELVSHTYSKSGSYLVTLIADVPYAVKEGEDGSEPQEWRYLRAKRTKKVDVAARHCGPISVRGVPVVPVVDAAETQAGSEGCFAVIGPGKYKTFAGHRIELGGLPIRSAGGLFIDTKAHTIAPKVPGDVLTVGFRKVAGLSGPTQAGTPNLITQTTKLTVPPLKPDKDIKASVAKVAAGGGGFKVGGLAAKQVEAYVAPAGGPFLKAAVELPPPLGPGTPPAVLNGAGAPAKRALAGKGADDRSHLGVPTDFSLDVGGQKLGPFELPGSFVLEHKQSGGWIGGGKIAIPELGVLDAPYKPPPAQASSDKCAEITGPSGISLGPNGQFEFGGAALTNTNIPVGPIALNCVAVKGQAVPFVLEGRVAGKVPPPGPFGVNGCFFFAVVEGGQTLSPGCAVAAWKASDKTVWLRAQGGVSVFGTNLSDGYVDIKTTGGSTAVAGGGRVNFIPIDTRLLTIKFAATVDGAVVIQPPAFHLIGKADICVENIGPNIGCHNIGSAGVSSKGMGFCTSIASAVKYWNDGADWWWGNCNLAKEIGVTRAVVRTRDGRSLVRGGGLRVPDGLSQVGIRVAGQPGAGSPVVRVVGPGRRPTTIVDNGEGFQQTSGYDVIHGIDETLVVVRKPRGGTWKVEAQPGSPPITSVGLRLPIDTPNVRASIKGGERRRVLAYKARLAPTDRVTFVESGKGVTRQIGRVGIRSGSGRIRIKPLDDLGGKRKITAVVARYGVPIKELKVASYKARKPLRLRPPKRLRVRRGANRLRVEWRRVRGADAYEVRARLKDGRILRERTRKPRTSFVDVPAELRAKVTVVAISGLRESKPASLKVRGKRPRPIVLSPPA